VEAHSCRIELGKRSYTVYLVGIGDVHWGAKNCAESLFREQVDWIRKTPNAYAFLGGDLIEAINYSDKRFDPKGVKTLKVKDKEKFVEPRYSTKIIQGSQFSNGNKDEFSLDNLITAQANEIIKELVPIKNKLLFSLTGNHEEKIRLKYHHDIAGYMAMQLGIPQLGYGAMIRVNFSRQVDSGASAVKSFILNASHGDGGGSNTGAKLNRLIQKARFIEADVFWCGHNHGKAHSTEIVLSITKAGEPIIFDKEKIFILGGSFLKTYQGGMISYGEKAGYAPAPLGNNILKIEPFHQKRIGKKNYNTPIRYSVFSLSNASVLIEDMPVKITHIAPKREKK